MWPFSINKSGYISKRNKLHFAERNLYLTLLFETGLKGRILMRTDLEEGEQGVPLDGFVLPNIAILNTIC